MNFILQVKNLKKVYSKKEKTGVYDVSFNIAKGDFHAFIGENGAGKTTTIKSIINSYTNWTGEILINGFCNKLAISKEKIGYVPENAFFPQDLTVMDYLMGLGLLSGIDKKSLKERIDHFLKKMKIEDLKNRKPYRFSSGQKKKVLLIQALINDPDLIILDEPTANLDPTARYEFFQNLLSLNKQGKTIFISSHVLSEVDKYVNSLTLIHQGKIVYTGKKYSSLEKIYYEKIF